MYKNNKTKNTIIISLLAIALLGASFGILSIDGMLIPPTSTSQVEEEPPLEEYHLKFSISQNFGYNDGIIYETANFTELAQFGTADFNLNINLGGGSIILEFPKHAWETCIISLYDDILIDTYEMPDPYGLYDFSSWEVIGSETIIPIYTPF